MSELHSAFRIPCSALEGWLPDMDLNHDKQIQSLLCYRYTIGQTSAPKLENGAGESRLAAGFVVRRLRRETVKRSGGRGQLFDAAATLRRLSA